MPKKRLFIFHYHYKSGGVTTAINSFIQLFHNFFDIILIGDGDFSGISKNNLQISSQKKLTALGYCENYSKDAIDKRYILIKNFFNMLNIINSDIFIFHNYSLGKNPALTKFVVDFSNSFDNQIIFFLHDFAESGRWNNLSYLYRTIGDNYFINKSNVKNIVINKKDYIKLKDVLKNLYYLAHFVDLQESKNMVTQYKKDSMWQILALYNSKIDKSLPLFLYPVRAIRRKNILEAVLLSKIYNANLVITLLPNSQRENLFFEKIKHVLQNERVVVGVGNDYDILSSLYKYSDLVLSTSVMEGFGFTYYDSLFYKKKLLARDIGILDENIKESIYLYTTILTSFNSKDYIEDFVVKTMKYIPNLKKMVLELIKNSGSLLNDFSYLELSKQIEVVENPKKYLVNYNQLYKLIDSCLKQREYVNSGNLIEYDKNVYIEKFLSILNEKKVLMSEIISSDNVLNKLFDISLLRPILYS